MLGHLPWSETPSFSIAKVTFALASRPVANLLTGSQGSSPFLTPSQASIWPAHDVETLTCLYHLGDMTQVVCNLFRTIVFIATIELNDHASCTET